MLCECFVSDICYNTVFKKLINRTKNDINMAVNTYLFGHFGIFLVSY